MGLLAKWKEKRRLAAEKREQQRQELAEAQRRSEALRRDKQREAAKKRMLEAKKHAAALKMLKQGKAVPYEGFPFPEQRGEMGLMVCDNLILCKQVVRKQYHGRSAGTSIRVAKGVSFRLGASRGTPIETQTFEEVDEGILALSTKHLFWRSFDITVGKAFKIPLDKLVTVQAAADGLVWVRDTANAKTEAVVGLLPKQRDFIVDAVPILVKLLSSSTKLEGVPQRDWDDGVLAYVTAGEDFDVAD